MHAPPSTVCLLLRSLYRLKQAPRNWNAHLHEFITSPEFCSTPQDACLYAKTVKGTVAFLAVFADDILLASISDVAITEVTQLFQSEFARTD
jgi:hypothetical protein